jgi:hypothetical protein
MDDIQDVSDVPRWDELSAREQAISNEFDPTRVSTYATLSVAYDTKATVQERTSTETETRVDGEWRRNYFVGLDLMGLHPHQQVASMLARGYECRVVTIRTITIVTPA